MNNFFLSLRVWLRSFLIQSVWNQRDMQNIGFLCMFEPVLKSLYKNTEDRKKAFLRHLKFFNNHPYFVPLVLGVCWNMEKDFSENSNKKDSAKNISMIKNRFSCPLAAIGDGLFWEALRPSLAILSLCVIYAFSFQARPTFFAILLFLFLFNSPHFLMKWWGLREGLRQGPLVIQTLKTIPFTKITSIIKNFGLLLAGFLSVQTLSFQHSFLFFFTGAAVIVIIYYGQKWVTSPLRWVYTIFLGSLAWEFIK